MEHYRSITGHYPTFNATVGRESLENADEIIAFFSQYGTRVTFSRMIGKYGITLKQYRDFLAYAEKYIPVRRGGKAEKTVLCTAVNAAQVQITTSLLMARFIIAATVLIYLLWVQAV